MVCLLAAPLVYKEEVGKTDMRSHSGARREFWYWKNTHFIVDGYGGVVGAALLRVDTRLPRLHRSPRIPDSIIPITHAAGRGR